MSGPREWWDESWNVITGCEPVSAGCMNCYARRMALQFQRSGNRRYQRGFRPTLHADAETLGRPASWGTPRFIFVCSMGDIFHEAAHADFIRRVFNVMTSESRHTYMLLTKRPERMLEWAQSISRWPSNVWAGVTVEDVSQLKRLDVLRQVPARTRFVSFEPLLSGIPEPDLSGITWAIIGGETGPDSRRMEKEWATALLDECLGQRLKVWFKQWGARHDLPMGTENVIEGITWMERPEPVGTQQSLF